MNNAIKHFYFSTKTTRIKKKITKLAKKKDTIEGKIDYELENLNYTCNALTELREIESKEDPYQDIINYLNETKEIEQEKQINKSQKTKNKKDKDEKK